MHSSVLMVRLELTLLLCPDQCTIAWLCAESPARAKVEVSRCGSLCLGLDPLASSPLCQYSALELESASPNVFLTIVSPLVSSFRFSDVPLLRFTLSLLSELVFSGTLAPAWSSSRLFLHFSPRSSQSGNVVVVVGNRRLVFSALLGVREPPVSVIKGLKTFAPSLPWIGTFDSLFTGDTTIRNLSFVLRELNSARPCNLGGKRSISANARREQLQNDHSPIASFPNR